MNWLDKMSYKHGRRAIKNLMMYIIIGMGIVFVLDLMFTRGMASEGTALAQGISPYLAFDRDLIFQGQVWRVITFIILPPSTDLIFIFFSLYFYFIIGRYLEQEWGSFRFNVYYFCGILSNIIAGLISGYATNTYLNLSLFFAFAIFYPDFRMYLFFFIPVKIKWLAYVDAAFFAISLVFYIIAARWDLVAAILMSLFNVALFFGPGLIKNTKNRLYAMNRKRKYEASIKRGQKQNRDYWDNR